MKTLRNLRQDECSNVAQRIALNAARQWGDALALARRRSYSSAIAWKVFALEEMVKAMVLEIDARGTRFRKLKNLKILDKNHHQRHLAILVVAAVDVLGDSLKAGVLWLQENPEQARNFTLDPEQASAFVIPLISKHYKSILGPAIVRTVQWASLLGALRTDAIYSDFKEEMLSPSDWDAATYKSHSKQLDRAYKAMQAAIKSIRSEDQAMTYGLDQLLKALQKPSVYIEMDEFIATHFRDTRAFDMIIVKLHESMK